MSSKIIFITGATDGIGKETAVKLVSSGHHVIIHGRNQQKLVDSEDYIYKKTAKPVYGKYSAELGKLESVNEMADQLLNDLDYLDVLINNAGVYVPKIELTNDGLEKTFAINHLSHFLLTNKILPLLRKSEQGRIVIVIPEYMHHLLISQIFRVKNFTMEAMHILFRSLQIFYMPKPCTGNQIILL